MTLHALSLRLGNWLEGSEQPVTLVTDSIGWDWPWISKIFTDPKTWPTNPNRSPEVLLFDTDSGEEFNNAIEFAFSNGLCRHHALDDAKANRLGWLAVREYRNRRRPATESKNL